MSAERTDEQPRREALESALAAAEQERDEAKQQASDVLNGLIAAGIGANMLAQERDTLRAALEAGAIPVRRSLR